jgi:integrase
MAITKIGQNLWQIKVSVRVPGKDYPIGKQEQFTGTKIDAQLRESDLIKEIKTVSTASRSLKVSHFGAALQIYTEKKNKTSAPDLSRIQRLKTDLGEIPLDQFPDRFERYLEAIRNTSTCRGKMPSGATINRLTEMVRAVFNLLIALEYIEKNPISKARFPKAEQKARDRYLSSEERIGLLNAIREHRPYLLPFIQYNLSVPCRKSELIQAKREQYNQFTNTIFIPDSKAGIPINKPVPAEMKDYFRNIPLDCPYLFYRQDKEGRFHSLGDFKRAWKYCLKQAGIVDAKIHDLRHVSASDLYSKGVPERVIMDIAGWKTPMLTTYRHKNSLKSAQEINTLFENVPDTLQFGQISVSN